LYAIKIPCDHEISATIAIEVVGDRSRNGGELRFDRKGTKGEASVTIVDSD
jgi:hypothetical protein